jgi:hypothetical protein
MHLHLRVEEEAFRVAARIARASRVHLAAQRREPPHRSIVEFTVGDDA